MVNYLFDRVPGEHAKSLAVTMKVLNTSPHDIFFVSQEGQQIFTHK